MVRDFKFKENRKEKVKIVDDEDMIIYINKLLLRKKNVEKKLEYYEKNYPDIDLYTAIVELYEEEKRNQTPN